MHGGRNTRICWKGILVSSEALFSPFVGSVLQYLVNYLSVRSLYPSQSKLIACLGVFPRYCIFLEVEYQSRSEMMGMKKTSDNWKLDELKMKNIKEFRKELTIFQVTFH